MKEAAGEANMTVITIILIALVAAIATPIIRGVMNNAKKSSCCASNGGVWIDGHCCAAGVEPCDEVSTTCPE